MSPFCRKNLLWLTGVDDIHVIKFFQPLSIRAALFLCVFVAWSNGYSLLFRTFLILMHSMKMADCDGTVLYCLRTAQLEAGGYCQIRWDGLCQEQPLVPCFTLIEPPLITSNCCSLCWIYTSSEARVSSPDDRILAKPVNNWGYAVSHAADPHLHVTNGSKGAVGY